MKKEFSVWVIRVLYYSCEWVELYFSSEEKATEFLSHAKTMAITAPSKKNYAHTGYPNQLIADRFEFEVNNPLSLTFEFNPNKFYELVYQLSDGASYEKIKQLELEVN